MKRIYLYAAMFGAIMSIAAGGQTPATNGDTVKRAASWTVVVTDPTQPKAKATPAGTDASDKKSDPEVKKPSSSESKNTAKAASDWKYTWSIQTRFTASFDTNLEHETERVGGLGEVPSVTAGYEARSRRHRFRLIYSFAAPRYNIATDLNRFGNYFSSGYRLSLGKLSFETEAEASFKGSNEDRETGDQFILTETIGYRFDRKTRLNVFGAYRIRRFAAEDAARNAVNPMIGFKFSRQLTRKLGWDAGFRYDVNRAAGVRNNYTRRTFRTGIDFQLTKNDRLEAEINYRPRRYKNRLVEVGLAEELRRDKKWSFDLAWTHNFGRRWGIEAAYQFERQTSNDVEKFYRNNAFVFSVFYNFGNGDVIEP